MGSQQESVGWGKGSGDGARKGTSARRNASFSNEAEICRYKFHFISTQQNENMMVTDFDLNYDLYCVLTKTLFF